MLIELDRLRQRLSALDTEREHLVALIAATENYERSLDAADRLEGRELELPYRGIRGRKTAEAASVADKLIERTDRPVRTREVVAELSARELLVPHDKQENMIAARLSTVPHLKARRHLGWWPAERPWPGERWP